MLISITAGETVKASRITRTDDGDTPADLPDVAQSAFGTETVAELDDMRGRRTIVERSWFCPRDADVAAGDRITRANGEVYSVLSEEFGSMPHPLTGSVFGVKSYRVRRVHTPHG